MSNTFIRHLIAASGMLIAAVVYLSGYVSSSLGWWWTAFGLIIVYVIVYKLVDV